jgi:hypothetical protein
MEQEERGLTSRLGPLEIDWPRSLGYFGGLGLAVAFEVIEPPLALVIAAVPFVRMLNLPGASWPVRFVSQLADGAVKPVGGDSEQTIRLTTHDSRLARGADGPRRMPGKRPLRTDRAAPNRTPRPRSRRPAALPAR